MNIFIIYCIFMLIYWGRFGGFITMFITLVLEKYSRFMIQNGAESTSENRKNHALLPIQLIHGWLGRKKHAYFTPPDPVPPHVPRHGRHAL